MGLTNSPGPLTASISLPIHIPAPYWQRAWFWQFVTSGVIALCALAIPTKAPKVVLMDIQLPGLSGIECVSRLLKTRIIT